MTQEQISLLQVLNDHKDKVWSVAVHPTLPLLATASADRTSKVYDLEDYQLITQLSETHKKSIRSVGWKPSGDFPCLALGSFDSTMSIWAKTDENFEAYSDDEEDDYQEEGCSSNKQWGLMAIIEGHENEIKSVSWSENGSYLASSSRDKTVWIWETDEYNEEFECINVLQDYHTQDVKFVKWGPDQYLISASYDETIKIFRELMVGDDLICVCDLNAHDGTIWAIDYEPINSIKNEESHWRFVSCSDDGSIKVWWLDQDNTSSPESEDWKLQASLPSIHKGPIYSIAWSGNSGRIASVGSDGNIIIYKENSTTHSWDVEIIKKLAHGVSEINSVIWIKNNSTSKSTEKLITAGDNGAVNIWEVII